ncbi:polymorphic toxin-type HINT domain-containing protein [Schlesneria sp. DSM 10557]|uniref:polymorphic toxin-type HINT domain-containing protein n=1 Tax=Schlesneria sp. DSM 10557 TaxID=3044399 RepID=UPI00359FB58E
MRALRQVNLLSRFIPVLFASTLGLWELSFPCQGAESAAGHVQAALQAAVDLDATRRNELVETALREDPSSAEAHWARGDVRVGQRWVSLEDFAAEKLAQPVTMKYWEQRAAARMTVAEQLKLAEYCRANKMPGAERAHLFAVVAIDPGHREARRRLGQVEQGGVWLDRQQLEQQKKRDAATNAYLRRHGKRLMALSAALQDKSKSEDVVLKGLREFDSPFVIPGLESWFSSTGEAGGLCAVKALAAMSAPEASISLARHAMAHQDRKVRAQAREFLKERDEYSYVPELLAALHMPVEKSDAIETTRLNEIVWRRRLMAESQSEQKIADLDRTFQFRGLNEMQDPISSEMVRLEVIQSDAELHVLNSRIEDTNDKILHLLAATMEGKATDETLGSKKPEVWWDWWNNKTESYPSEPKSVAYLHETSRQDIAPPLAQLRPPRHECLAAGTPIWTETGLLAVDQVKSGDLVLTQNPQSGELKFAPVLMTTTRPPERLLRLSFNGEVVRATGGHLFWVNGKGWTKARSLAPGMGLHTARGFAKVDSVTEEQDPEATYNLIVDECHSYFVGKELVLSHDNTPCQAVANRVPGLK